MAKIGIFRAEGKEFISAAVDPDGEIEGSSLIRHAGGEDELQLFEVIVNPDHEAKLHAHKESEIIYIVEGEMQVGTRVLTRGDSIFIDGMTIYGFRAGRQGVRFLNFRARQDLTYYSKDEFMEFKKLDPAAQAAMTDRLVKARLQYLGWD